MPPDRHGWSNLETYIRVHNRVLQDFLNEGFVVEHTLEYDHSRIGFMRIEGRIRYQGGLFIDVRKQLRVRQAGRRLQVRTIRYRYHAGIEGRMSRPIFRYDNAHTYLREGHPDPRRKHLFDHPSWKEIRSPEWIGEDGWPHLSDVIEELRQWWETTGQHLHLQPQSRRATSCFTV